MKSYFNCPCCNKEVEIEVDNIRVMISNPSGTVGGTKEFKVVESQPRSIAGCTPDDLKNVQTNQQECCGNTASGGRE